MWFQDNFLFVDQQSGSFTSNEYINYKADSLTIQVDGTFSDVDIVVEGKTNQQAETYYPIAVVNLGDLELCADGAITSSGRYAADISGTKVIRVRVDSVTGGNVTVFGVATNSAGV